MVRSLSLRWVKRCPGGRLLRPSTGVRTSLNSGHDINRPVQWRLVPLAAVATPRAVTLLGLENELQAWIVRRG